MEEERIKKEKDDAKAIEMQRMKVYRETLDHQKQINEFNSGRLGTMTQVEKQFNKKALDLAEACEDLPQEQAWWKKSMRNKENCQSM